MCAGKKERPERSSTSAGTTHSCAAFARASAPADLRTNRPLKVSVWPAFCMREYCCANIARNCPIHLSASTSNATWDEVRMGHSACLLPAFTAPGEAGESSLSSSGNTAFSSLLTPAFAAAVGPAAWYSCKHVQGHVSGSGTDATPTIQCMFPKFSGAPGSTPRGQQPHILLQGPHHAE